MACLQAGTIVSATVEQAIENCLVVFVKHKSKIFRGVLFDEKNAVVSRTSLRGQTSSSLDEKDNNYKLNGGSNFGNGGPRCSTRQASLFYRRQNSFRCRKIPSSSTGVTVLTDANLIKEHLESYNSSMDETATKQTSVSSDQKARQVQVNKTKEALKKKPHSTSQVDVQRSKSDSNLKRNAQEQDSKYVRPSKMKTKGDQNMVVATKGANKQASKKPTPEKCKSPIKSEVVKGSVRSIVSKSSKEKPFSPEQYKILTRPCSVPVVPVNTAPNSGLQSRTGTVMVIKKILSSTGTQTNASLPSKSLPAVDNVVQGVECHVKQVDQEHCSKQDLLQKEGDVIAGSKENGDDMSDKAISTVVKQVEPDSTVVKQVEPVSTSDIDGETTTVADKNLESAMISKTIHEDQDHNESRDGLSENSEDKELTGVCELKQQDDTIKRSARISEKKAKTSAQPLLIKRRKCELENFQELSDFVGEVDPKQDQGNAFCGMLGSGHLITLQDNEKTDNTSADSVTTRQTDLKRNKGTVTKYTQRKSWVLKPQMATGRLTPVSVGDIVWGKVHGHPWWPGKVLAVSGIRNEGGDNPWDRDAHVSWFGSSTSSIMHLHALQLFLPNFAKRHKRQKKGCYRTAVRQAQEATKGVAVKEL